MNGVTALLVLGVALSLYPLPAVVGSGYTRSDWKHWIDADQDCQDTRQEVLIRDSYTAVVLKDDGCSVVSGVWISPYTNTPETDPSRLDIDHIVPLKWAFEHGARGWSPTLRQVFANDPENLVAVRAGENRSKGSRGPDRYLPLVGIGQYLQKWCSVTGRYNLEMVEECQR